MGTEDKKEYSFWKLIKEYKIVIPKIQRDYAQGRENKTVKRIADSFIDNIFEALDKSKPLSLDFIYGKINKNKEFLPLDGQQRLTTLYLLHWYLGVRSETKEVLVLTCLEKFTYKVRLSSQDFCSYLVKEPIIIDKIDDNEISKSIKDSNWYNSSFDNDPTVKSMLNMLDIIHEKFKGKGNEYYNGLLNKLMGDNSPITFMLLSLGDYGLSDELYIKMNARGKPLSKYENFKSGFVKYLSDDYKEKIDNKWLDLFWKIKLEDYNEDKNNSLDVLLYNFYFNLTHCFYLEYEDDIGEDGKEVKRHKHKYNSNDPYFLFDIYKDVYGYDGTSKNIDYKRELGKDYISLLADTLNYIIDTDKKCLERDEIRKRFKSFIKNDNDYKDKLKFYSMVYYIRYSTENGNPEEESEPYKKYKRVTDNLINNISINNKNYDNCIKLIKLLARGIGNDFYKYIITDNKLRTFKFKQLEEEIIKAFLIYKDKENKWEEEIDNLEKHDYFNGQIRGVIELSNEDKILDNISNCNDIKLNNNYYANFFDKFVKYSEVLRATFDSSDAIDFNLLRRALLTFGYYRIQNKYIWSFCVYNKNSDVSFKKLINDSYKYKGEVKYDGAEENVLRNNYYILKEFLKKLCNTLDDNNLVQPTIIEKIKYKLEEIINSYIDKVREFNCREEKTFYWNVDWWRYYLIKYDKILEKDFNAEYRIGYSWIDLGGNKRYERVLIIPDNKKTTASENLEILTSALWYSYEESENIFERISTGRGRAHRRVLKIIGTNKYIVDKHGGYVIFEFDGEIENFKEAFDRYEREADNIEIYSLEGNNGTKSIKEIIKDIK